MYHSQLGRFASRDPLGYKGSQSSLQQYVDDNPLAFADSMGLKPLGQKWEVPDFFWWYYFGFGQDVPLGEVGLLIPWWNHIKPQIYLALKLKLLPNLESRLDCVSGKTAAQLDVTPFTIPVTAGGGITDPLTVMGHSQVKVRGTCSIKVDCQLCCDGSLKISASSGHCDLDFSVRDKFQNPLDWGGPFGRKDWPGATMYRLVASWFHVYTWSEEYNPCPENQKLQH